MEPSSSEEDRNSAQLEAIFRAHVADLYRYIYRQVHQAVIAEDLTSSVFLKALRWLQQDRSPESVKGWLYATARSLIADYWREQTQINLLPLETAEEIPALSPESNDEQQQVRQTSLSRLLDELPSRERDVLTLRYFQGYSAAEIGQALGLSANYVRVLQLRALRHAASRETTERTVSMESPALPYNQQALRVLELTKEEARTLNHNSIGTEHLLLGILDEGSAATELINHGLTAERFRGAIVYIVERSPALPGDTQEAGYTPRTQAIFVLGASEAQRMGETAISPHHLLVAILREGEGIAAAVLQASGVRLKQVGDAVRLIIDTRNNPFDKFPPRAHKAGNYGFVASSTTSDGVGIPGGVGGGRDYEEHVIFYVGVPDVEAALQKAERLGGARQMGPKKNSETGLVLGHFTDPEGNLIGVAGPM